MKTIALAFIALAGLTSCNLTLNPDGSKSVIVDGEQLNRTLEKVIVSAAK